MEIINKKSGKKERNRTKAIIFDFDDTLINTKDVSIEKHKEAARILGIDFDEKELIRRWGQPWPMLLYEFLGDKADKFVKIMGRLENFEFGQIKGAEKAILYAKQNKMFIGILSSSERKWVLRKAESASINLQHFDDWLIICNEDVEKHKPNPSAFNIILKRLSEKGLNKDEVLYCGDNLIDFETAKNAGINFMAVTTGFTEKEHFIEAGLSGEMIIPSIKELPEKLENLNLLK